VPDLYLVSIASFCFSLPFMRQPTTTFFPQKKEKNKKREMKRNAFQTAKRRAVVKVCSKKYSLKRSGKGRLF
jgi:hypothetical protein